MLWVLELLFGCRHHRRTWPLSVVAGQRRAAYTVCLDCGREFPWTPPRDAAQSAGAVVTEARQTA
jgi:hypothetical protein